MKKIRLVVLLSLVVGVSFVQADVLPEYNANTEKLVGIEMRANVADFPEWMFIQEISRSFDDVTFFEVINDEGVLGCNRTHYIDKLLAVKLSSPEERQQLMYEINVHANEIQELTDLQYEVSDELSESRSANGRVEEKTETEKALSTQIKNLEVQMKNNRKNMYHLLQEKGAIRLFSGQYFWQLWCTEHKVVKKGFVPDKVLSEGWLKEVKINHLTITSKMLENGEALPPVVIWNDEEWWEGVVDDEIDIITWNDETLTGEDVPQTASFPEEEPQGFWEHLRTSIVCFFKGLFGKTC